jgi:hypothetical protein
VSKPGRAKMHAGRALPETSFDLALRIKHRHQSTRGQRRFHAAMGLPNTLTPPKVHATPRLMSLAAHDKRSLYQSIYGEGVAEGEAKALLQLLIARLGKVPPEARQIIFAQAQASPDTVSVWFTEAALALDAEAAGRLLRKILST